MNELTKNIQKMMVPKAAIIAYKYEDRRIRHQVLHRIASHRKKADRWGQVSPSHTNS